MVVKFRVIASGSNGNSSYFSTPNVTILIDVGISRRRIIEALREDKIPLYSIIGILVSHAHLDHCEGLPTLFSTINKMIYCSRGTWESMNNKNFFNSHPQWTKMSKNTRIFNLNSTFKINEIIINPIPTIHDEKESAAFQIIYRGVSISIITDTGRVLLEHTKAMEESQVILLETNYDKESLERSNRPIFLKNRIMNTHLSNFQAVKSLNNLRSNCKTKFIYFGHVSDECNSPKLIKKELRSSSFFNTSPSTREWKICDRNRSYDIIRVSEYYPNRILSFNHKKKSQRIIFQKFDQDEHRIEKDDSSSNDCFIATAAYGSPLEPRLNVLRKFRDKIMIPNTFGSLLVRSYYRISPPYAKLISKSNFGRKLIQWLLNIVINHFLRTKMISNKEKVVNIKVIRSEDLPFNS